MKPKETIAKFKSWLENKGCEILPTTNEYESLRWRGLEVGVLYKSGKYSGVYAEDAFKAFNRGKPWKGGKITTGRKSSYRKQKKQLLKRDGNLCFFCHLPLGEDITIEHLISLSCSGSNQLNNMVLAHEKCNRYAGNMGVVEKVRIAVENRLKLEYVK